MNDSKTEMILFASPLVKLPALTGTVGLESVQSPRQLIYLGVTLDEHLSVNAHIMRVCQVSYFQLKTIRTIHDVLWSDAVWRLVHAFVTVEVSSAPDTF